MKTIELKLYEFNELSEDAKQKALEKIDLSMDMEFYLNDADKTLKAFQRIFPIEWKEIDYTNGQSYSKYVGEDNHKNLSGIRLLKLLENNYLHYIR
jgi:hypothetical protein